MAWPDCCYAAAVSRIRRLCVPEPWIKYFEERWDFQESGEFSLAFFMGATKGGSFLPSLIILAGTVIWAMLLFFLYEMAYVKDTLECQTHQDLLKRRILWSRLRKFMFFVLLGIYFPANMIQFAQQNLYGVSNMTLVYIRAISMSIVCIWSFPAFLQYFFFFVTKKRLMLYSKGKHLSTFSKYMIVWVLFNWLLKFLQAIFTIVVITYQRTSQPNVPENLQLAYLITMRPYQYIVDCINMSTIIYLFYCQAQVKLREARKLQPKMSNLSGNDSDEETNINESIGTEAINKILKKASPKIQRQKYIDSTSVQCETSKGSMFSQRKQVENIEIPIGASYRDEVESSYQTQMEAGNEGATIFRAYILQQLKTIS